jgi:hypothetical protein
VVLNESLDISLDRITGTGRSAVYFSRICPESPVKLRLCGPNEQGSVMSNYINIGEDQPFEWNIVTLSMYLYGVEDPRDRPLFGSFKIKHLLEERYRAKYLTEDCGGPPCATSYKAEWREMVAATLIRSIYIFLIDTTADQDRELIANFNSSPNRNHFNGVTSNCADFTRRVVNTYFPHATNPDYINDFGMTSPKAIARSLTRYALRHPEANLRVLHFAQVPGNIKRSSECRDGTEQLYRSKEFLIPMVIFADHELPAVMASYLIKGRFNPEHEFEKHPAAEMDADHGKKFRQLRRASDPRSLAPPRNGGNIEGHLTLSRRKLSTERSSLAADTSIIFSGTSTRQAHCLSTATEHYGWRFRETAKPSEWASVQTTFSLTDLTHSWRTNCCWRGAIVF